MPDTATPEMMDTDTIDIAKLPLASGDGADFDPADILTPAQSLEPDELLRIEAFLDDGKGRHFLAFLSEHSPFLGGLLRRDVRFLSTIIELGPAGAVERAVEGLGIGGTDESQKDLMIRLRRGKRRAALAIAWADILEIWNVAEVTDALSRVAEVALDAATAFCVRELARSGSARIKDESDPCRDCGWTVLGMGKFGAKELNYSSDIDIIILYDPEKLDPRDPDRLRQDTIRAARQLMRIMDERTAEGYVFRTDLRLRPDPSVTPPAITVRAAETYYESLGQNWERAAMIKARPVAGDRRLGDEFLTHIKPFIWRKFLDFAAIQDIHSIKRQINAYRGGAKIAVHGHNVKIGRGGIREIEFFAQTQQLIWGGRQPGLRLRRTCAALDALVAEGHAGASAVDELKSAYAFLRRLEHRLQMVNDAQTHSLPEEDTPFEAIARFMGYAGPAEFERDVRSELETVERHYARLFEEAPDLGGGGALVFTGTDDDPETLDNLARMGFRDTSRIAERIRIWHRGRYRATRSERSRQILTELMPRLLQTLADTADPDEAFSRFDGFLEGLPAGVQLFSLFHAHPKLLDLVATVLGSAPRLAGWMSRKPILLDAVLNPDFFDPPEEPEALRETLKSGLDQARDFQDVMDITRRWANDRKFQAGVHLLRGITDGVRIGPVLSDVAEVAIAHLLPAVEEGFADTHGRFSSNGSMAVVAFGKLGGRELMPMSDVDLLFAYDVEEGGAGESDGAKPLGPQVYHLRLAQRLVTAISSETGEGRLYEVDTRLRPGGKAGPLATQFESLAKYYQLDGGDAWTWEHMALTRARVVCGPVDLAHRLEETFRTALCQERDPTRLVVDIHKMRRRIAREFPGNRAWDIKYRPGGVIDLEFIAQHLQLAHAHAAPEVLSQNTGTALENLNGAGILSNSDFNDLKDAHTLWRRLQAMIRLTAEGKFDAENAPHGQRRVIAEATGLQSFDDVLPALEEAAGAVCAAYDRIVAMPAGSANAD